MLERVWIALRAEGIRTVVRNLHRAGVRIFIAVLQSFGKSASPVTESIGPLKHPAAPGIDAVEAGLHANEGGHQIKGTVGFLNEIKFKLEIKNVVPGCEIPLIAKVIADRAELHFHVTVGLQSAIDGLKSPGFPRREPD